MAGDEREQDSGSLRQGGVDWGEAAKRLREAQARTDLTNPTVAREVDVSLRTLARWRKGESAPDGRQAQQLAELFGDSALGNNWEVRSTPVAPGKWFRRPSVILIALAVLVAVSAAIGWLLISRTSQADTQPGLPSTPNAATPTQASALPEAGVITLVVNVALTSGQQGQAVGGWSLPSTNTGCQSSPCQVGTVQVGRALNGRKLLVSCVRMGQLIQNGPPGESGYYRDARWLLLARAEDVGQRQPQRVWVSNVWLSRGSLPKTVPTCPTG